MNTRLLAKAHSPSFHEQSVPLQFSLLSIKCPQKKRLTTQSDVSKGN
jgi:hypothetical protein